jgi:uncharacterized membrane protein YfcA
LALAEERSSFLFWSFFSVYHNTSSQGTTLALLVPPIGFLAAWTYYKQGYVNLQIAAFICLGFFFGGLLGAKFATKLSNVVLERVFGVALLLIALKMIFSK